MYHLRPAGYFELSEPNDLANRQDAAQPYYFYYSSNKQQSAFKAEESTARQRVAALEQLIYDLVESSANTATEATSKGEDEDQLIAAALASAKESVVALESLSSTLAHEQRWSAAANISDDDQHDRDPGRRETQPMTTSTNLFDLTVMVKSNLAAQLRNNNYLQEALDIYVQLCKMAGNSALFAESLMGESQTASSSGQKQEARFCLHRFGLNVGNIHFEMQDHQRALKFYRLTLDRLAPASGYRQLKLKLANNISLALIAMGPPRRPSSDSVSSLNQLLTDNRRPLPVGHQSQQTSAAPPSVSAEAVNANHPRFVLNLMVCLFLRSGLDRMLGVLSDSVVVCYDSAHRRVARAVGPIERHERVGSGSTTSSTATVLEQQAAGGTAQINSHDGEDDDELETLLKSREAQTQRNLKLACKLILELADRNQASGSGGRRAATLDQCLQILHSSPTTRALTLDLKTECVTEQMEARSGLEEAVGLFEDLARQRLVDQTRQAASRRTKSAARARTAKPSPESGLWSQAAEVVDGGASTRLGSTSLLNKLSLAYSLDGQAEAALEVARQALAANKCSPSCWINLGNCYQWLANHEQAESCYDRALELEPNSLLAGYNLAQLARKMGRNYDDLGPKARGTLLADRGALSRLLYANLILLPVQVGLLCEGSASGKQFESIFAELADRRQRCPPEAHLLLARWASRSRRPEAGAALASKPAQLLEAAHRNHSYHLPLAESLVATCIESFDYRTAERVLSECIKNRPDQVRWYRMLAECRRHSADYEGAIRVYKLASDLFPLDTSCLRALAKLAHELGLEAEHEACRTKLERVEQGKRG